MAHAQKPDFVFRRNGRVHLNWPGRQFSRLLAAEMCISGSNTGYTMFRGSVKSTGNPLHSPVFLLLPLPCVTVCHHISTGLYQHDHQAISIFISCGAATQRGSWPPNLRGFLDHTQRRTTVGRTPLDEWSARRRELYLTTHNNHNRQTSMPPVGFEPTISAGERSQTYVLDRAATGTGTKQFL